MSGLWYVPVLDTQSSNLLSAVPEAESKGEAMWNERCLGGSNGAIRHYDL